MIWTEDPEIRDWLPRLQSHRGYWVDGIVPNTLTSIQAAYELGYEMVEFDVRLTADKVCILFHDNNLKEMKIKTSTLQSLRNNLTISTLEEVFEWFSSVKKFKLNIEIKSREIIDGALETEVVRLIRKFNLEKRVMVSSFNPFTLYKIRTLCPTVYRAILLTLSEEHGNNFFIRSLLLNFLCRPHMLNLRFSDYAEKYQLLAQKVPVVLWTVNDLAFYRAVETKVHGIISDEITPDNLKVVHDAEIR